MKDLRKAKRYISFLLTKYGTMINLEGEFFNRKDLEFFDREYIIGLYYEIKSDQDDMNELEDSKY